MLRVGSVPVNLTMTVQGPPRSCRVGRGGPMAHVLQGAFKPPGSVVEETGAELG